MLALMRRRVDRYCTVSLEAQRARAKAVLVIFVVISALKAAQLWMR